MPEDGLTLDNGLTQAIHNTAGLSACNANIPPVINKHTIERIEQICDGVASWLENEGGMLERAVERTIDEGLFQRNDVQYMIDQARITVTKTALSKWAEREMKVNPRTEPPPSEGKTKPKKQTVLCLHAGNLPMVGLQDVIATLLSGSCYFGKLSGKDPWLLDSLLHILQKRFPDQVRQWSARMEDLQGIRADKVLFAGSQASVQPVLEKVIALHLVRTGGKVSLHEAASGAKTNAAPGPDTGTGMNSIFLHRTARLSMAWLTGADTPLATTLARQLAGAMLRYEGKGCRSVAVVVAPLTLEECAGPMVGALEEYVKKNPFSRRSGPGTHYWKSYLKSMGRPVYQSGPVLITDDFDMAGKEDVICWVKGNAGTVARMADRFGPQLQHVYLAASPPNEKSPSANHSRVIRHPHIRFASLSGAQSPPIDWQPDGVDVLRWLTEFSP